MSCWWDYDVVVYGDRDKLIELEKVLPELTYDTVSGDQAKVCQRFPMLTFGGTFYNYTAPDMHWTFEGRNGELAVQEHVDNDFEERAMTAEELKALIEKRAAKIETLQEELADLKYYLVRHHRDQIGDALLDHEITAISAHINAEDKEATT